MAARRYWDSNCFLSWLQEEPNKAQDCADVLQLAETGKTTIITSTLTIAEVLMVRGQKRLLRDRRASVEDLFNREYIKPITLTRRIAESARELVWEHGIHPKEAVHVASALAANGEVLNTFDEKLISKSGMIGTAKLIIERPAVAEPQFRLQ